MKILSFLVLLFASPISFSQTETETRADFDRWEKKGDSLLLAKSYPLAVKAYLNACRFDSERCPGDKIKFAMAQIENCVDCPNTPDTSKNRSFRKHARKSKRKIRFL